MKMSLPWLQSGGKNNTFATDPLIFIFFTLDSIMKLCQKIITHCLMS